jgi:hypothetical protein
VLEDIACDHNEFGTGFGRQRAKTGDGVSAGCRIPRLRLAVQKVTGHAELPVGGVHESHLGPSFLSRLLGGHPLASRV